jgi:hypothetical protein
VDFRINPADADGLRLLIRKYKPAHHVRNVPDAETAEQLINSLAASGITSAEVVTAPGGKLFVRWRA